MSAVSWCRQNIKEGMITWHGISVVVQFYPWFKFSLFLLQTHYHVINIHYHTQKQKTRKFEPRINLNHNRIHWQLCGKCGLERANSWYEQKPEGVVESETFKTLRDLTVQCDRKIEARRPHIHQTSAKG